MIIKFKRPLLSSALAAALVAIHWTGVLDLAIQPGYSQGAGPAPEKTATEDLSSTFRERRGLLENRSFTSGSSGNAFPGITWTPPKRAPAVAAPKGSQVPPFAYTYMGRLWAGGSSTILFLTKADNLYWLREGDVVDGVFRIDAIKEDHVELVHIATKTRLTRSYDELVAPRPAAQAGVTPGSPMTMAQATSPAAGNPPAARPEDRRAAEEKSDSKPAAMGIFSGPGPAAAASPAASSAPTQAAPAPASTPAAGSPASTPMAPSPPGGPMQMLPPGEPMEMTMPPANTVPPQGLNPTYPANVVPPQGAGK